MPNGNETTPAQTDKVPSVNWWQKDKLIPPPSDLPAMGVVVKTNMGPPPPRRPEDIAAD